MGVDLPNLLAARCYFLSICGRVQATAVDVPTVFRDQSSWQTTRFNQSGQVIYLRVGWTPSRTEGKSCHLHFDFVKKEWFDWRKMTPEDSVRMEDVESLLKAVYGLEYEADVDGHYGVPKESLPFLVGSVINASTIVSDGVTIELTGGEFSISGAPVQRLRWDKGVHKDGYRLIVTSAGPTVIDAELFNNALAFVETGFSGLYSGEVSNV